MDKLTYEDKETVLNFYALDFEEFLRENFQPGTMSMEHALNMLSWPAFEPVFVPCNSRTRYETRRPVWSSDASSP